MVDGQTEKDREAVESTSVVFSSDSQHLAYGARVPKDFGGLSSGDCVVVDGNEGAFMMKYILALLVVQLA